MAVSAAYDRRRRSSGWMLCKTPSPAKVPSSKMLKVPASSTWPLVFFSQIARNGTGSASLSLSSLELQTVTFSASSADCRIGTSADWFLPIVYLLLQVVFEIIANFGRVGFWGNFCTDSFDRNCLV